MPLTGDRATPTLSRSRPGRVPSPFPAVTTRQRNLSFLLAVAVLASIGLYLAQPQGGLARGGILGAIPRDAFLVVTIDVEALRVSPLAVPLLGGDSTKLLGVGALAETCGFDPLTRVKELALAVPEGGDHGDFGLLAMGDLRQAELLDCAQKVIVARGGHPKMGKRGTFTTVEDDDDPGGAKPRIALREGGPLLVGRGAWLQSMIDAAEGKIPSVRAGSPHLALREALTAHRDGKPARSIIATAVLPKSLRERLKREMGAEIGAAEPGSNVAMGGVLSVETAGVAITAGAAGQESEAAAELRCESTEACDEVKKLILKKRLGFSQDFGARLIGLGPLIDSLVVETNATALTASAHAPTEDVAKALDRVLKLRNERPRPAPPAPSGAPPPQLAPSAPSPSGSGERIAAPKPSAPAATAPKPPGSK